MHPNDEILGLDVGKKRTGIARASSLARIAEPLMSVPTDRLEDILRELTVDKKVSIIVVGLPRNLNGDDTEQTQWTRAKVSGLASSFTPEFFWQDEALTSVNSEAGAKSHGRDIDAMAAASILDDFLKTPEEDRVRC